MGDPVFVWLLCNDAAHLILFSCENDNVIVKSSKMIRRCVAHYPELHAERTLNQSYESFLAGFFSKKPRSPFISLTAFGSSFLRRRR